MAWSVGVVLSAPALAAGATYLDDIGFTRLAAGLGAATPNGSGVSVMIVEAATGTDNSVVPSLPIWSPVAAPGAAGAPYSGVTFSFLPGASGRSTQISGHAAGVADIFFGDASMANGIGNVEAAYANDWLQSGFLKLESSTDPSSSSARIINHSWVGRFADSTTNTAFPALDAEALRRTDWLVHRDSVINVVAMNNGSVNQPLLGSSFNSIAVGLSSANSAQGSVSLQGTDAAYAQVRTRPDVVAPSGATSGAAPIVSALSAVLVETGHEAGTQLSNGSTTDRAGNTIYNAERAETIKATLMAGADRDTANTGTSAQIADYRAGGFATSNGLDSRYGAGQVNAVNSYNIIAAGERDAGPLGCSATVLLCAGFDFNENFTGQPGTAVEYSFTADVIHDQLSASLVWDLDVQSFAANGDAQLYQLGLSLFDETTGTLVATSGSLADNTQNLWLRLVSGHDYTMSVFSLQAAAFNWRYALAWNVSTAPVPLPPALVLLLTAIAGLLPFRRARNQ